MTAEKLVDHLLEAEFGPPVPDNFTNAQDSMKNLMSLERQKLGTMQKLGPALGLERQLRKAGVTREQVGSFVRADQKYPNQYSRLRPAPRGALPPDAIVGIKLRDGREIDFDLAIMPEHTW